MVEIITDKIWDKIKKYMLLGFDLNNKKLYPGDFVEVCVPFSIKSPWCSQIYWHPLSGAYIERHPAFKRMDNLTIDDPCQIPLLSIMNDMKSYGESNNQHTREVRPTVKKITQSKYTKWYKQYKKEHNE
jgi:hypothetical protein